MGLKRAWTKEEDERLQELYGRKPIKTIAHMLGRSENAIIVRRQKLGLGAFLDNGDYITLSMLLKAVKGRNTVDGYANISWIKNRGLPVHYQQVGQCKFKVVYLQEFWKWAEANKAFMDFSKMPEMALGKEPDWVKEQRYLDTKRSTMQKFTPWTKVEDSRLIAYIKEGQKTGDEIARLLKRSQGAVLRRCQDLGIGNPQRIAPHAHTWTGEELQRAVQGVLQAVPYPILAAELGISERAIRGTMYRMYKTEKQDKIRAIVKKEQETSQGGI